MLQNKHKIKIIVEIQQGCRLADREFKRHYL